MKAVLNISRNAYEKAKAEPLVSIIVPVYNGERYLRQCIESIINQTYSNWELLLIDDGSTDNSAKICDEYATDERIRVEHKEHGGQAKARNEGLKKAKGEYIGFVDCDDWIEPEMYETIIHVLLSNDCDVIVCGYIEEYVKYKKLINADGKLTMYDCDEALKLLLKEKIGSYLWSMLFNRNLIQEPMPDLSIYEDHAIIFKWISHAHRVAVLQQPLYHYRQLQGSCLHSYNSQKYICFFEAIKDRYHYVNDHGLLPGWEAENKKQYIRGCVKLTKDIARSANDSKQSEELIYSIKREMELYMPIKRREIGTKHYFRLLLLMANVSLYIRVLRWTSFFLWSKRRKESAMFPANHKFAGLRPKIAFLISRFLDGGIDSVLVDYLNSLSASGKYQITLLIEQKMDELEVFMAQVPSNVQVYHLIQNKALTKWRKQKIVHHLSFLEKVYDEGFLSPIRRYLIVRLLKKMALQNDVIIDFDCCSYSLLENINIKKIAWFHFSFKETMKQNRRRMKRIGEHLNDYDKIVTISNAMYEEGCHLFPELQNKLVVIYNAKKREELLKRAEEAVEDKRINQSYILAIERLEESQKDLTTLLHAFQILRQQYNHTEKLYLLGKGQSENYLQQLVLTLGLVGEVVFLGFYDNPYPWLQHAKLLVHSAKLEGLPTVLVEGLMLDKLMVATDCPTGPREILAGGMAGLLTPVGDAQAMAEAMHRLLTDKKLQTEIIGNVQRHRAHFMYEKTLEAFDNLITEVI